MSSTCGLWKRNENKWSLHWTGNHATWLGRLHQGRWKPQIGTDTKQVGWLSQFLPYCNQNLNIVPRLKPVRRTALNWRSSYFESKTFAAISKAARTSVLLVWSESVILSLTGYKQRSFSTQRQAPVDVTSGWRLYQRHLMKGTLQYPLQQGYFY